MAPTCRGVLVIRVAITGIGVVTPLGHDPTAFADRLLAGESAAAPITHFDPATLDTRIAAQADATGLPEFRDRKVAFAIAAARSAIVDAQAHGTALHRHYGADHGGLSIGLGLELFCLDDLIRQRSGLGPMPGSHPLTFLQTPSDICVPLIAHEHRLVAPPLVHVSACAAATDAIGAAFHQLRRGRRRWLLAGGSDSMINPLGVAGFCKIQAMTRRNHDPRRASRPFDLTRDGFLLGEGAAMLVLEPLADAAARGARILGEIGGYGSTCDAHGISEPHPQGDGALRAMQLAMRDAGVAADDIVHVSAHGTSTPKNDAIEALALGRLFGPRVAEVPVSAMKSMIGHLISASGAVEIAGLALCANRGWLPPTINLDQPDPACAIDVVRQPRPARAGWQLKNSFGFGGQNACIALRFPEAATRP